MKKIGTGTVILIVSMLLAACQSGNGVTKQSTDVAGVTANTPSTQTQITEAGSYRFTGPLEEAIKVSAGEEDNVEIILDNVEIKSSSTSPIYVESAKNVTLILAEGSTNVVRDNRSSENVDEAPESEEPNAAIYSKTDLEVQGAPGAALQIFGGYKDGLTSRDDLSIKDCSIDIQAQDDGVVGKDSITLEGSSLQLEVGGDGLKSDNDEDTEKGRISSTDTEIAMTVGDDGIHAVQAIDIYSGDVKIQQSYEGIEAKKITIHDGTIDIVSTDDALNVADSAASTTASTTTATKGAIAMGTTAPATMETIPAAASGTPPFMPGPQGGRNRGGGGMFAVLDGGELNVNGGTITLNSGGDGFDSNGNAVMTGGTLIVNGPVKADNGAIDVNGTFTVSGGTIIAVGSAGMAEAPSETSSQNAIQVNMDTVQEAGVEVSLLDETGNVIFSYIPTKQFQSVTFSSAQLQQGATYKFLLAGQEYASIPLEGVVTRYGNGGGMGNVMGMGMRPGNGERAMLNSGVVPVQE